MNDLQAVRELAERRAREDAQIANLPALEAAQREQEQIERAALEADKLDSELTVSLATLQPQRQESDAEFVAGVQALKAIVKRRQQMGDGIFQLASRLAEAELTCGRKRSPLLRQDAIRATAEDELKRRIGTSHPMPITALEWNLAEILDALTAPPQQPTYYPMPETASRHQLR